MLAEPTAAQRDVLDRDALLAQRRPPAHRPLGACRRPGTPGRRGTSPARRDGRSLVTYDLTRLQRLDTDDPLLRHPRAARTSSTRRRSSTGWSTSTRSTTPLRSRPRALLPAIDTERISFAGAYHGWGFHEDGARSGLRGRDRLGLTWPDGAAPTRRADDVPTGAYETTIRHTRRTPFRRSFTHRSHLWVVDLDDLPDHGMLARFEAPRPPRDEPARTIRANVDAFLADHGIDLTGGRVVMAANARAFGYCFNPISVFWCWDAAGTARGHRGRGAQHLRRPARLPRPPRPAGPGHARPRRCTSRRSTAPTAPTTWPSRSPTTTGSTSRSPCAPTTAPGSAPRCPAVARTSPRARPHQRQSGSPLLIRMHGIWLWLRRLPIQPRPTHDQNAHKRRRVRHDGHLGAPRCEPLARPRRAADRSPRPDLGPDRPRPCSRRRSTVSTSPCTSATRRSDAAGPPWS